MTVITWTPEVNPAVKIPLEEFAEVVEKVLGDPRGWRKYGYDFRRVSSAPGGGTSTRFIRVRLEPSADADRLCGATGFSCWRPNAGEVVFHLGNWMGGSKSSLPLDRYRNYVVNHEVGHALGLMHQKCPAEQCAQRGVTPCPASIMQQMTRGPKAVSPCVETDWPLEPDWTIDDPRIAPKPSWATGGDPVAVGPSRLSNRTIFVLMVAALTLVVIIVLAAILWSPDAPPENYAPVL